MSYITSTNKDDNKRGIKPFHASTSIQFGCTFDVVACILVVFAILIFCLHFLFYTICYQGSFLPDIMSTHFLSLSDAIETGLLLFTDFFHPSSFFNSAHIASLSESGVSRATVIVCWPAHFYHKKRHMRIFIRM